ncbi:hypothetical protein E3E36_04565 [Thermococcus sp. M36]|uniref:hypothetical protein n=1 Tax=Thermococcus sp. M36 TaxID=1638261 RepID=UPI00143A446C|nr:hypothetical protein [Thermococcus sp. M36]NJE05426.1 hypothetical protein [Thermococcus sp. M36]
MRRAIGLLFLALAVLAPLPQASAGYNGAERLEFDVVVISGDSAILSVTYTTYSPSMSGSLVPTVCCLSFNFYANSSGTYLIDESWEKPVVHWYRGFYYVFITPTIGNNSLEVFRLGEDCFERVTTIRPEIEDYQMDFAIAMPYLVVRVAPWKLVAINIAKNVTVDTLDLTRAENGAYFKGVTIVKEGSRTRLVGDNPESPPSPLKPDLRDGNLIVALGRGKVSIPLERLRPYLWSEEEAEHIRVYPLESGILMIPPDVMHYFAPDANSTGELLIFGNEKVPVRSISAVYVIHYNGTLKAFKLGEPAGSGFIVNAENVSFRACHPPETHEVAFWTAVILLAVIGFVGFFVVKK